MVLDNENIVQPDLLVVCDQAKITERNIQGPPDLIVEIISPTSSILDRREKKRLYEQFGVREYIVVDPMGDTVKRHILHHGRFKATDIFNWDENLISEVFPDLELPLWSVFDRELPQAESDNAVRKG